MFYYARKIAIIFIHVYNALKGIKKEFNYERKRNIV